MLPWAPLPRFVASEHVELITRALQRQSLEEVNRGPGASDFDVADDGSVDDEEDDAEDTFIVSHASNSATAAGLPRVFGPPPPPAALSAGRS